MSYNIDSNLRPGDRNQERIFSIKDINKYINMKLEGDSLLQDVWIRGEISNYVHHSRGHLYFTLKDEESRIKCVMFARQAQSLPFIPKNGTKVIARGAISVYERDGQYQFYAQSMQPDGIGSLYLAFEQLKKKLEGEGLFAATRKRPLPLFPRTIGVITSPTGAAIRDIIITLKRRYPQANVLLYPVLVQGTKAGASIVHAIEEMNRLAEADVLIVGRGGGSLEELWAFNEEMTARAISNSSIPIISAVGHETDFTIADFVSDLRAATPTAAAELAVPNHLELRQQIERAKQRLHQSLQDQLRLLRERVHRLNRSTILTQPHRHLLQRAERVDRLTEQLVYRMRNQHARAAEVTSRLDRRLARHNPQEAILAARKRLDSLQQRLKLNIKSLMKDYRQQLLSSIRHLDAVSPLKVMQRGYSLVYDEKEQKLIRSMEELQLGDMLNIRLKDGKIGCHVWSMEGIKNEEGDGGTPV